MRWGLTLILHYYLSFGMDFFEQRDFFFPLFYFWGKKQKLLLIYRQVICMCFQVYGLSNIDLLRCVCVCLLCRALSLILFLFTLPEFCLFNSLSLSLKLTQFSVLFSVFLCFCLNVFVCASCCCMSRKGGREGRTTKGEGTNNPANTNKHNSNFTFGYILPDQTL